MGDEKQSFYDDENEKNSDDDDNDSKHVYVMDSDHRLLLRSTKVLLQSRNSAV